MFFFQNKTKLTSFFSHNNQLIKNFIKKCIKYEIKFNKTLAESYVNNEEGIASILN